MSATWILFVTLWFGNGYVIQPVIQPGLTQQACEQAAEKYNQPFTGQYTKDGYPVPMAHAFCVEK